MDSTAPGVASGGGSPEIACDREEERRVEPAAKLKSSALTGRGAERTTRGAGERGRQDVGRKERALEEKRREVAL